MILSSGVDRVTTEVDCSIVVVEEEGEAVGDARMVDRRVVSDRTHQVDAIDSTTAMARAAERRVYTAALRTSFQCV